MDFTVLIDALTKVNLVYFQHLPVSALSHTFLTTLFVKENKNLLSFHFSIKNLDY